MVSRSVPGDRGTVGVLLAPPVALPAAAAADTAPEVMPRRRAGAEPSSPRLPSHPPGDRGPGRDVRA